MNGFRIELREVEKALEAHEAVGLALASVTHPGTPEGAAGGLGYPCGVGAVPDRRGFATGCFNTAPRPYGASSLCCAQLSGNAGGKIDIAALPHPVSHSSDVKITSHPTDPVIAFLCDSFAALLGVEHVNPDMSFFDLGGHSLLAVRLIGRIEAQYGQRLSIAALRNEPTPNALARMLAEGSATDRNTSIVEIQPNGTRTPIFGVHVLGPNEAFFRLWPKLWGRINPCWG